MSCQKHLRLVGRVRQRSEGIAEGTIREFKLEDKRRKGETEVIDDQVLINKIIKVPENAGLSETLRFRALVN